MRETDFNLHFIHGWRNPDGSVNRGSERPMVLGTGPQVRQSVVTAKYAVGFIKASQVDDSVKVVAIDASRGRQRSQR